MPTYLLIPLFFAADYVASEETIAAGIKGYKQRADAVRKQAIVELEDQLRVQAAGISAVKKAAVDPKLVGTVGANGMKRGEKLLFATAEDKAAQVRVLSNGAAGLQETLAGIKSRKLYPQVEYDARFPGGCGVFAGKLAVMSVISENSLRAQIPVKGRIIEGGTEIAYGGSFVVAELRGVNTFGIQRGDSVSLPNVFQFREIDDTTPILYAVPELPTGEIKFLLKADGHLHETYHD